MIRSVRNKPIPRLVYYSQEADVQYWREHWEQNLSPEFYKLAEQGNLGRYHNIFMSHLPEQGRIIEAGCGLGQIVLALDKHGYTVEGIEWDQNTVEKVCSLYPDISIKVGDVTNLSVPDGYYSAYISLGVVEHREEGPEPFLQEAYRVLAPGGKILISVPHFNTLRYLKARLGFYRSEANDLAFYQYAFTNHEFVNIIQKVGFEIIETYGYSLVKGLTDELKCLHHLFSLRGGWRLKRWIGKQSYLEKHLGHMILVIGKKKAIDPGL